MRKTGLWLLCRSDYRSCFIFLEQRWFLFRIELAEVELVEFPQFFAKSFIEEFWVFLFDLEIIGASFGR